MKIKLTRPFSSLKPENWKNLLFFAIICFYFVLFFSFLLGGARGSDYEAYWVTGKIADTKGYSKIYNLSEMKVVYRQIIDESADNVNNEAFINQIFPAPYFSLFFVPFQFLSRISVISGFKIWTFINLAILIGYLFFFLRRIESGNGTNLSKLKLLIPFLISYSVFFNIMCGQVEVFVLICAGEFLRNAAKKRPIRSGLWLGGLLLKPQLLILIIPIFIIMRYWKTLIGFFASSGIIIAISLQLSGITGMLALINLWTKYGAGIPASAIQIMINWRMIGANINNLFSTTFGWAITSLGMTLTILTVFFLLKRIPSYGSPLWVMTILGVFTATLAITWHSHYHMAMVIIPFLIYAFVHKLLPEKYILTWSYITPLVFIGTLLFETVFFALITSKLGINHMNILGLTGLILNMVILFSVLQALKVRSLTNNEIS